MPIGPARMPLIEHLGELRMHIVRIFAVLAVAVVVFYLAAGTAGQFCDLTFLPQFAVDAVFFDRTTEHL